jgi:hypothetical protein
MQIFIGHVYAAYGNSTEQSFSKTYSLSDIKAIHRFLLNTNVHYRVHKNPPLVCILRHTNVVLNIFKTLVHHDQFRYYSPIYSYISEILSSRYVIQ